MDVYNDAIRNLTPADTLRLVERIWDDLAAELGSLPLPDGAEIEAARRRDEMLADPKLGSTDDEFWKRIYDSLDG